MQSNFPTVLGHNAPPARLTRSAKTWLIVLLCLPILAFCLALDGLYYAITRLG